MDLTSLKKSFIAFTRLSSAGPGVSLRGRIWSGRIGRDMFGRMCGMRFAAGRSKYGAFGSPWVGGRTHGISFAILVCVCSAGLESVDSPDWRMSFTVVICPGSQYLSLAQIESRSFNLWVVFDFFSSKALVNKKGKMDGICSRTCLRNCSSWL